MKLWFHNSFKRSIDHHPRGNCCSTHVRGEFGGFFFGLALLAVDVGFEATVEVVDAHARVNDGHHDQREGNNGEEGHRGTSGKIVDSGERRVHAVELEAEVCHGSEEKELDRN